MNSSASWRRRPNTPARGRWQRCSLTACPFTTAERQQLVTLCTCEHLKASPRLHTELLRQRAVHEAHDLLRRRGLAVALLIGAAGAVVIDAKSSAGTELGRRTLPGGCQVSQGSRANPRPVSP